MRTTDNELTSRIYKVFYIVVEQCQHLFRLYLRFHAWHQNVQNVLSNLRQHLFVGFQLCLGRIVGRLYKVVVLGRNHNRINALRNVVVAVFHRYLAL